MAAGREKPISKPLGLLYSGPTRAFSQPVVRLSEVSCNFHLRSTLTKGVIVSITLVRVNMPMPEEVPSQRHETLPEYALAIKDALATGYRVDPEAGVIYGLKGLPLIIKNRGLQRYPTVSLVTPGMRNRFYAVPAHKVIAYALWGDFAFAPGMHVRHGKLGVENITSANLSLGTAKDNEADKDPSVKSAVAKIARAAQDGLSNAKLNAEQVASLRAEYAALKQQHAPKKRLPNGTVVVLVAKYGIGRTNIMDIVTGKIWNR